MKSTVGSAWRNRTTAIRLAALLGLLLMGTIAQPAGATEMDKGAFKKGCNEGGHSFVDNADGSFQCNLDGGAKIKCQDTKSPCTYTSKISPGGDVDIVVHLTTAGTLELVNPPLSGRSTKPGQATQGSK